MAFEHHCPVCIGRVSIECGHPPALVAAAVKRNDAIDSACKEFAAARDRLRAGRKPYAHDQMIAYERKLDRAKDAAWSEYRKAQAAIEVSS